MSASITSNNRMKVHANASSARMRARPGPRRPKSRVARGSAAATGGDQHKWTVGRHWEPIAVAEGVVHYFVAAVLIAIAGLILFDTGHTLLSQPNPIDVAATVIDDLLFAVIIIEIVRTVVSHFDHGRLELERLLVIAIVSGIREVLSVSAQLSLNGSAMTAGVADTRLLELGIDTAVVLGLVAALALLRKPADFGASG
jgi:uncharacterized membrane protein (DUF373 family)